MKKTIENLYLEILDRKVDDNGLKFYLNKINEGKDITWIRNV